MRPGTIPRDDPAAPRDEPACLWNRRTGRSRSPRIDGVRRTRDRLSSVRFRDGRGSRSPLRRPGRGERASSSAAYRRRAELAGRVRWTPWQRFIVLTARVAPAWCDAILLIQPGTILRWHRAGFRAFWRRRSRRPGRPPPRVPPLSGRWRRTTHAGAPSASHGELSLPRFRGHRGYAANARERQSASASFGLRYSLRECNLRAL